MRCNVCDKEFGSGTKCQHCGADRVTAGCYGQTVKKGSSTNEDSPKNVNSTNPHDDGMTVCPFPDCNQIIPKGSKFCPYCGKQLIVECPNPKCGQSYPAQYPCCPHCGTNREAYILEQKFKEEVARKKAAEEKKRRQEAEEAARKKAAEEEKKRKEAEEEAGKRKAEEEERRREAAKKAAAEEERRRKERASIMSRPECKFAVNMLNSCSKKITPIDINLLVILIFVPSVVIIPIAVKVFFDIFPNYRAEVFVTVFGIYIYSIIKFVLYARKGESNQAVLKEKFIKIVNKRRKKDYNIEHKKGWEIVDFIMQHYFLFFPPDIKTIQEFVFRAAKYSESHNKDDNC